MGDAVEYKDNFTLDGRLKPGPGVTKTKVLAVKKMLEAGLRGDDIEAARFKASISTTDAIFNAVYLTTLQALPQFDKRERTWSQIATTRVLPDFRPAVLTGIFGEFEGLKRDDVGANNPAGVAPVVPELAPYPYATVGNVEAAYGRIKKRGFKVGWSWEAQVNDAIGFFEQIPGEMLETALDTEEWEVYQALIGGTTSGQQLAGGTVFTGETVPANSPLSRNAVLRAIFELSQRLVNGRNIQVNGGYNLLVPVGAGAAARFALNQQIIQKLPGSSGGFLYTVEDQDAVLGSVTIIETPYVTGTNWYLLPKPGTTRRPVLELGRLRGQETPELRVDAHTGNYVGGGAVSPFEGNFQNDAIDIRLRYPLTGILWFNTFIVWSTGAGA